MLFSCGFYFVFCLLFVVYCFFFFKQQTAYELRISDCSSDVCSSDLLLECNFVGFLHRKRRLALTHETMLFLGSVGFFVLGHRPVSHTVAGGAGRTEGPFISADKALAVTLAAFGFRGFVHHADASTALIAPTTDSVSRARVSFRSMPTASDRKSTRLNSSN